MNFVDEINAFERWLESNFLPPISQLLWYKLFMLNNRAGWIEWIQVDNQRLMALIGIKREATFIDYRDKLLESGLLEYKKGKKGYPNKYKINSLTKKCTFRNEVQTVVQSVVNTEVQSGVQVVDITKRNETKQNNIPPPEIGGEIKKQNKFGTDSKEMELACLLAKLMKENNDNCKLPNDFQAWCKEFDLMMRRDRREFEDAKDIIKFSQWDGFWKGNILSAAAVRKQYDKLILARERIATT